MTITNRILLASVIAIFASAAHANLSAKIELESGIQNKVRSLLASLDPDAQVLVTVTLKKVSADLPALGVTVESAGFSQSPTSISVSDIEAVDVRVISKVQPFPAPVRTLIEKSLSLSDIKAHFTFEKMDQSVMRAIAAREPDRKTETSSVKAWEPLFEDVSRLSNSEERHLIALYSLGAVLFISGFVFLFVLRALVKGEVAKLVSVFSSIAEKSAESLTPLAIKTSEKTGLALGARVDGDSSERLLVQSFNVNALVAILSDCYWCEEDRYASWLWSQMTGQQRMLVVQAWPMAGDYAQTLREAEFKSFHNHPSYLTPMNLRQVPNSDLLTWIKANPQAWHFLSPLRQAHLELSLIEKIEFSKSPRLSVVPAMPVALHSERVLESSISLSDISLADEEAIFKNPNQIPSSLRPEIKSIVWLALLSNEVREEILSKISAQQLAEAWIGPEAVLAIVSKSLPEKKMKLIEDYRKTIQPSRNSTVMAYLSQEALAATSAPLSDEFERGQREKIAS